MDVQELARDQNNIGFRVELPPVSDMAIVFQLPKIMKKTKTKMKMQISDKK